MAKHLNTNQFSLGTSDILLYNIMINTCYLIHIQFTRQHHHIGILSIELQRLCIGDIELGRKMHFNTRSKSILQCCDIRSDDSRYACCLSMIHDLTHQRQVLWIHHCVEC